MRSRSRSIAPGQLGLGLFDDAHAIRDLIVSSLVGDTSVRIVSELALRQGTARADLAVISDRIDGYEIKSAHDDMRRLVRQAPLYSEVFDTVTIVTDARHAVVAQTVAPGWWGIAIADSASRSIDIARTPETNPTPIPEALVRLLRRDEAVRLIAERTGNAPRRATRQQLWSKLLQVIEPDDLRTTVCWALRERQDWSAAY